MCGVNAPVVVAGLLANLSFTVQFGSVIPPVVVAGPLAPKFGGDNYRRTPAQCVLCTSDCPSHIQEQSVTPYSGASNPGS